MDPILEWLGTIGVVPVIAITDAKDAPQLGQALIDGELPCAEITFRTAAAEEAIQILALAHPEILVGAGTVLTIDQAKRAVSAGAKFLVSPGFDPELVKWCENRKVTIAPGVATPTEINMALAHNLQIVKFFPAGAMGGPKTLEAIAAPYGDVKFIPTGGVNQDNLADYLQLPAVHACGGSWLVKRSLIESGNFEEITRLTREAVAIVKDTRS